METYDHHFWTTKATESKYALNDIQYVTDLLQLATNISDDYRIYRFGQLQLMHKKTEDEFRQLPPDLKRRRDEHLAVIRVLRQREWNKIQRLHLTTDLAKGEVEPGRIECFTNSSDNF